MNIPQKHLKPLIRVADRALAIRSLRRVWFSDWGKKTDGTKIGAPGSLLTKSFIGLVVIPSILALMYFGLIASSVYVSEGKLTVREAYEPEGSSTSGGAGSLASIIGKIGIASGANTGQDSMIISDYLKSRSVIDDIGGRSKIESIYAAPHIDWLSRLGVNEDLEDIWDYWKNRVSVYVDPSSGIVTVRVRAYTAGEAQNLAKELLTHSETLINDISRRNREDALSRAREEVDRGMRELASARADILNFQTKSDLLDPQETAKGIMALISDLTLKQIALESQLASAGRLGATNRPGDKYQQTNLDVLKMQISQLDAMLTGPNANSLSSKLKDYELLKLKEQFAEQLYTIARSSFEEARRKANRQLLYVAVIVPPALPDAPLFPKPFQETGVVFLTLLVFWAIGCLLIATVRDSAQT